MGYPNSPVGRAAAVMAAFAVLSQFAGCASNPTVPRARAELSYGFYETNGRSVSLRGLAVDGKPLGTKEYVVAGAHKVTVTVEWSNGWEDDNTLDVDLADSRQYVILVFELASGQAPSGAVLTPPRPGSELLEISGKALAQGALIGALPLIIVTAPIWGPIWYLTHKGTAASGRPFENCCFIWIQDVSTEAAVAGKGPSGYRIGTHSTQVKQHEEGRD